MILREKIDEIESEYRSGLTLQQIGDKYGVTRERVRQILRRFSIPREAGGSLVRTARKRQRAEQKRIQWWLAKYGMTREAYRSIPAHIRAAYSRQRNNARLRGVAFTLSFRDWYEVWTSSGKLHLRGRGRGRYCMSRINDGGGYELGNVFITSCRENGAEYQRKVRSGKRQPRARVATGVYLMYPGFSKPYVAQIGGRRQGYYASVEDALAARAALRAKAA